MAQDQNKKDQSGDKMREAPKDQKDSQGREKVGQTAPEDRAGSGQQR